jgi:hypothetical protein
MDTHADRDGRAEREKMQCFFPLSGMIIVSFVMSSLLACFF